MREATVAAEMLAGVGDGPGIKLALQQSGLLTAAFRVAHQAPDPRDLLRCLVTIGQADLSAGRIFEGHVNAVKLLLLHDAPASSVEHHGLYGIWGADGSSPVRIEDRRLRGYKLFASGADILDRVIVSATTEEGIQLLLIPTSSLQDRLYPEEWRMSGMHATASGRCDLEGLSLDHAVFLGEPGAYLQEPYFQGGVWRYAAVQLGAMQALTAITRDQLRRRDQLGAPIQLMRLKAMTLACETVRLWLEQAALATERVDAVEGDSLSSIFARLQTQQEAMKVLGLADEALGAASFAIGHPAEKIRRDLGLYLRQANPDGMALDAMQRMLASQELSSRWIP
ncbi:acyl-CoA dehydrogenase family protein [Paracoccus zeaxanthinifaciens]|uniref:acyl-CoA dehydrogenase family protein n=1 Tax=Paracoccus zeaxanthinifaciens TaxID=187400 RepID=UPI000403E9F5|nr:acyl-CoA dehydrogenase family protein [Paracoccus zeaxanthinifaciens]